MQEILFAWCHDVVKWLKLRVAGYKEMFVTRLETLVWWKNLAKPPPPPSLPPYFIFLEK